MPNLLQSLQNYDLGHLHIIAELWGISLSAPDARQGRKNLAKEMLAAYQDQDPDDALVTTLAQEREMNTFFRLQSPSVIAKLAEDFPEIGDSPDPKTVFLKLRELRNSW